MAIQVYLPKRVGWPGCALLGQPSKGHLCRILVLFSIMFYYVISTTYKKLETYFALILCLDFRSVCTITYVWVLQDKSWQSGTFRAHNFFCCCFLYVKNYTAFVK